ncbi:MAG TPA: hypothetical protein VFS28_01150 [Gemmatimonadales bacterium]|nr:hypothetical protein [Gemmatimonadales bacterium]
MTHLFTLGWLTTSIMGALYQFLPVALGRAIASERVAHLSFALHVPGVALFVTGVASGRETPLLVGITAVATGIVLFLGNLGATLRRAQRRDVTWWAIAFAGAFLAVTLLFGVTLGLNLRSGFLGGARLVALGTHLHVALFGWVLLVIVGVSQRLLPMFLLSHGGRTAPGRWAVGLLAAGAAVLALCHHLPVLGREVPAALLGAGVVAYLAQAREYFRRRNRPVLDPGLRLAAAALVVLAAALPLGAAVAARAVGSRGETAYVATVVLACSLFVTAHYYKIVPFLIWNRYFGPLAGTRPLPRVADLYARPPADLAVALLVAGAAALVAGIAAAVAPAVRAGGALFAGGVAIEAAQLTVTARRRP